LNKPRKHLSIVIPVYNEGQIIKRVINSIPRRIKGVNSISVIAVDDGSTDNSEEQISRTRAILLRHPINMGAGSATITGLKATQRINSDIIVTLDGDGQHDPSEIEKLIAPILQERADIVIGTRLKKTGNMPTIKKIGNWGLNLITFAVSRVWTTDSQSGFKAFSKCAISKIDIEGMGYEFCSEIIIEAKRHKLKMAEVPIKAIYTEYSNKKGQSILNGTNIVIKLLLSKLTRTK